MFRIRPVKVDKKRRRDTERRRRKKRGCRVDR